MYRSSANGWKKHLDFILLDIVALQLACILSYELRFQNIAWVFDNEPYYALALVLTGIDALVCVLADTMHNVLKRNRWQELMATLKQAVLLFAVLLVYLFSVKSSSVYSRIALYLLLAFYIVFSYGLRLLYKRIIGKLNFKSKKRSMLLVAEEDEVETYLKKLGGKNNLHFNLIGVVLTNRDAAGESVCGMPVEVNLNEAAEYVCREWVDEVFIGESYQSESVQKLVRDCQKMGVVVHTVLPVEKTVARKVFVEKIDEYTVLTSSITLATPLEAAVKRLMDILGGLAGCVLALIVMAFVGPKIKKASPGPILYSQDRIGQNGKRFKFYKIRSMYLDADARKAELMSQNRVADGMMFKMDFDPRIIGNEVLPDGTHKTGIGAWIRDRSLDEFPQFFNVLKGDMSLVGTRPPTVDEWEKYKLHHRARLAMKPGLTGMWQVSGRSSITDFEEIVKLDTEYICNWNLGLDIKILFKTVAAVLKKDGAM